MKKLTLASIITSVLATSAFAAQQDTTTQEITAQATHSNFATLDTNQDGFISQGEASKDNVWNYFVKVDEDANGQLSPREFNTYASIYSKADIGLADTVVVGENADTVDSKEQLATSDTDAAMGDTSDSIDTADKAMDDAKSAMDEVSDNPKEMADTQLSQAKQNAISANAQNSNAKLDTQLTEHDSHDDVNASAGTNNKMKDAESNAQNALDNAKELSAKGQSSLDHNADAMNKELESSAVEGLQDEVSDKSETEQQNLAASSDVSIDADLERSNPALKAPEQPAPIEQDFSEVDANADGFISKEEAKNAEISEHFDNADVDSDDKISQEEYDTFVKGQQLTMRYSVRYPYESD
ncbi:EF-hand domain-containing protein [Paraglaciecola mesophila]|uniref:EF-hand domain-containing protein n=1 Tax=Paraglaciecola mesophila TaxID=197222 RepID=A0ABU9SY11_9ALTE